MKSAVKAILSIAILTLTFGAFAQPGRETANSSTFAAQEPQTPSAPPLLASAQQDMVSALFDKIQRATQAGDYAAAIAMAPQLLKNAERLGDS